LHLIVDGYGADASRLERAILMDRERSSIASDGGPADG
jgi:hypothetical protein